MQPEEKRGKKTRQGVSHLRALLAKNMAWLPGYPLESTADSRGLRWRGGPAGRPECETRIDRECLRQMEMTLNKIRYHFPKALPKLVGDAASWLARMDHLSERLKQTIHHGRPFSLQDSLDEGIFGERIQRRLVSLQRKTPSLSPLLERVGHRELTGTAAPSETFWRWLDENAEMLSRLQKTPQPLKAQLRFCSLHEELSPYLLNLLTETLAEPQAWRLFQVDFDVYSRRLAKAIKKEETALPPRPDRPPWGNLLLETLEQLTLLKPKLRRQAARLLERLLPADLPQQIRRFGEALEEDQRRLAGWLLKRNAEGRPPERRRKPPTPEAWSDDDEKALAKISVVVRKTPTCHLAELTAWNDFFAALTEETSEFLRGLYCMWGGRFSPKQFLAVLRLFTRLLRRRGLHPHLGEHWRSEIEESSHWECLDNLLDCEHSERIIRRAIELLEEAVYQRNAPLPQKLWGTLGEFAEAETDLQQTAELIVALSSRDSNHYYCAQDIQAALLTEDVPTAAILLEKMQEDKYEYLQLRLWAMKDWLGDSRLRTALRRSVQRDDLEAIQSLAECVQLLPDQERKTPLSPLSPLSSPTDWVAFYPPELQPPLKELSRVSLDAEKIARRLLSKDLPRDDELHAQIRCLDDLLARQEGELSDVARLQKRRENLLGRLGAAPRIGPGRLQNLAEKIRRRVDFELLEQYLGRARQAARDTLRKELGVQQFPETLLKPPYTHALAGISQLQGQSRRLGARVLRECVQGAAYVGAEAEENDNFCRRLRERNVRLEPWLGEEIHVSEMTETGEPYQVRFTRDPWDFLLMGYHFSTCLSPHSFNFFSAVANAVDVNKQVAYGKTAAGEIIGRCLFALTSEGLILTYRPYGHHYADRFDQAVEKFAAQLAEAMRTHVIAQGEPPALVSRDWYDDGVIALASKLNTRDPESELRTLLRKTPPEALLERLHELIGSPDLTRTTLRYLLKCPEFFDKSPRILPLAEQYGRDPQVSLPVKAALAGGAHYAGGSSLAFAILARLPAKRLWSHYRQNRMGGYGHTVVSSEIVMRMLAEYNPSFALRLFRATRPHNVKSDLDECGHRRRVLAMIHRRLGREKQAKELS